MQSMEKTQTSGFAKFASLVYLYTGLGITFWMLSAFALSKNQAFIFPILQWTARHGFLSFMVVLIVPVMLIYLCQAMAQRSYFLTFVCYLAFLFALSFIGVPLFFAYSATAIMRALAISSVTFIVMAGYGYLTKTNLMSWNRTLTVGLIAVIVVSLLNLLLFKSSLGQLLISVVTIILFMGYIALDSQSLKRIYQTVPSSSLGAIALVASVNLVLDFINLLMSILAIFGNDN